MLYHELNIMTIMNCSGHILSRGTQQTSSLFATFNHSLRRVQILQKQTIYLHMIYFNIYAWIPYDGILIMKLKWCKVIYT